jgi:CubicO group peptidase (beta-lactamase class C family)
VRQNLKADDRGKFGGSKSKMTQIIYGHCDTRFASVQEAFLDNFENRDEIGACVSVVVEGEAVVDLWAGYMDGARTRPWREDTIVNIWSVGKGIATLCLLKSLEEQGISVDEKVASVWPEFAVQDKTDITIAMVLAHRAGLCAVEEPLPNDAFYHWDVMTSAIAAQKPWWEPDTNHGYHTNTFGFLLGEIVRRVSGLPIRDYLQKHIASVLSVDCHFGVPKSALHQCADLIHSPRPPNLRPGLSGTPDPDDPISQMRHLVYNNPSLGHYDFNSDDWHMSEFPSTSPQSNARATAAIFSELAQVMAGKKSGLVSRSMLERATEINSDGEDLNLLRPTRFGLGFQLTQPVRPLGPSPGTFGHYGNGGHLAFSDPTIPLGFAYHMNHHGFAWRDPRNIALTDAVYDSLRK